MPSSVGSHHPLPYLSVRFVSLCLWLPDSLISLFLKKTLDQLPLKEHTLPFHIPYTNPSVVLHFMLLWKQQEYGTKLRYHCRGKIMYSWLCVSMIPYGTFPTLSWYLAMRICFRLSSRLKFRIHLALSGDFQSIFTVPVISLIPLLINKRTSASTDIVLLG